MRTKTTTELTVGHQARFFVLEFLRPDSSPLLDMYARIFSVCGDFINFETSQLSLRLLKVSIEVGT